MTPPELPLEALFLALRGHGLPLGIDDYLVVLQSLRGGFGTNDWRDLERLCVIAWAKSAEDARMVTRLLREQLALEAPQKSAEPPGGGTAGATDTGMSQPLKGQVEHAPAQAGQTRIVAPDVDPMEVIQAVRHGADWSGLAERPRFLLAGEYFPVTRRQMKQGWRHLRRPVRKGPPVELDLSGTVARLAREGVLAEPVLRPRRVNRTGLTLLLDQGGSMVPFHALSRQLIETAERGGRLARSDVYYFHDCPDGFLYVNPGRSDGRPEAEVLSGFDDRAVALVVSDAGAARGHFDRRRLQATRAFLVRLRQSARRYAWLNPMPHSRWAGTTAGEVACLVPMFELSRPGLDAAIRTLRGRYVYGEKAYPWMR